MNSSAEGGVRVINGKGIERKVWNGVKRSEMC
jgi:hypothetical protein